MDDISLASGAESRCSLHEGARATRNSNATRHAGNNHTGWTPGSLPRCQYVLKSPTGSKFRIPCSARYATPTRHPENDLLGSTISLGPGLCTSTSQQICAAMSSSGRFSRWSSVRKDCVGANVVEPITTSLVHVDQDSACKLTH